LDGKYRYRFVAYSNIATVLTLVIADQRRRNHKIAAGVFDYSLRMDIATALTIRCVQASTSAIEPRSEVLCDGRGTGKFIPGAILEAAVQWRDRYLLFATDDIPYEEMLRVLLLDRHFAQLDSARIGAPYSTGTFAALTLTQPDRVSFRFIGATIWTVQLLPRPRLRWPLLSEPPGVRRACGWTRHFIVDGQPIPNKRGDQAGRVSRWPA
jgi:hypothetical protein